jgi:hypothetical protein
MRSAAALAVVLCLLLGGCGGSAGTSTTASAPAGLQTIQELWQSAREHVGITAGTENHEPGPVRVSFLIIDRHGRPVVRPTARIWVSTGLDAPPFLRTVASLQRVGVPGGDEALAGTYYVARFRLPRAGKYWLLAEPLGGRRQVSALGNVIAGSLDADGNVVSSEDPPPDVGDPAIPSHTPTISSTGGDLAALTTRTPPDLPLLRYSIADSLARHSPFVVVFATPKFCASRTCGPNVDVVLAAERRFRTSGIRFIHVEVYEDNDPAKGYNRWMKEWKLDTEPWTFLVDSKGRIVARFEGVLSLAELDQAIRSTLLPR